MSCNDHFDIHDLPMKAAKHRVESLRNQLAQNESLEVLTLIQLSLNLTVCARPFVYEETQFRRLNCAIIHLKVSFFSIATTLRLSYMIVYECKHGRRNESKVHWSSFIHNSSLPLLVFQRSLKSKKKCWQSWKYVVCSWRGKKETIESWKPHFDAVWLRL